MVTETLIALTATPPPIAPDAAEHLAHGLYGMKGRAASLSGERDRGGNREKGDGPRLDGQS
jgi:hypothetical protein